MAALPFVSPLLSNDRPSSFPDLDGTSLELTDWAGATLADTELYQILLPLFKHLAQNKHSYYVVRMESNLAFLCNDVSRLFRKRFDEFAREVGSTGVQWRVLLMLQHWPGVNQGVLADKLEVEPITACRMVDRLEQAGLVERRRDPDDRRAWQVFLTEAGQPVVAQLREIGAELLELAVSDLTAEESELLKNCLTKVRNTLSMSEDAPIKAAVHNG